MDNVRNYSSRYRFTLILEANTIYLSSSLFSLNSLGGYLDLQFRLVSNSALPLAVSCILLLLHLLLLPKPCQAPILDQEA